MISIGAFQAKTHFSEILKRVQAGEEFCVTNHGKIVAIILGVDEAYKNKAKSAFTRLQQLKAKHPLGKSKEIITWKNEGRK